MFAGVRDYLVFLEKNGKLLRVKKEVDTRFEIAAGIRKISDTDGPVLLFENIKGFPGWKVVGGLFATQKLTALALGLPMEADEDSILKHYLTFDQRKVAPKLVSTGPVKEVIIKGKDVDLGKLPVPLYSALDSGPYLLAGVEIGRHPDTGVQNVSIHRREIQGKNRTAIFAGGYHHLDRMILAAEQKGQGFGIATVIGADPSLSIASQIKAPEGVDETDIAGALRSAPLEMVKCETIDVAVPAHAEIIIEGVTIPGKRVLDGPFGEVLGNYITLSGTPRTEVPVIEVTAITMRKNPIFQAMLSGMPMTENHFLKKWAIAAAAYRVASKIADVKTVNATAGGAAGYHFAVAIRKKDDGEPKKVINALLSSRIGGAKYVVVVDDDINVYDPTDMEWAIATRMNADTDVIIVPGIQGGTAQPSTTRTAKWGIDATAPLKDAYWYQKVNIPVVEKVDYV